MKQKGYYVEEDRVGELRCFEQSAPAHTVSAYAHIHNAVELIYTLKGSYNVLLDGKNYRMLPGDMILFCSGAIHHITSEGEEENSYYVIKINPSVLWDLSNEGQGAQYVMRFALNRQERTCFWTRQDLQGSAILQAVERLIREQENPGYASDLAKRVYATTLLLAILRDKPVEEENLPGDEITHRIYDVMLYVREHYGEDIDEKSLAKNMGMSYSYFSRTFRRVTGQSFRKYLNTIRVDRAERKLLTTSKSVSDVSLECGYNSLSYFISVYRSIKGETPRSTSAKRK